MLRKLYFILFTFSAIPAASLQFIAMGDDINENVDGKLWSAAAAKNDYHLCTSVKNRFPTAKQQDAFYLSLALAKLEADVDVERGTLAQVLQVPIREFNLKKYDKLSNQYEKVSRQLLEKQSQLKAFRRRLNPVMCGGETGKSGEKSLFNAVLSYVNLIGYGVGQNISLGETATNEFYIRYHYDPPVGLNYTDSARKLEVLLEALKNCTVHDGSNSLMRKVAKEITEGFNQYNTGHHIKAHSRSIKSQVLQNKVLSELLKCPDDTKLDSDVGEEMASIIKKTSFVASNQKTIQKIADALLRSLEEKFSAKKWFVVVFSEGDEPSNRKIDYVHSRGFYTRSTNGIFAAALSVDRTDDPELSSLLKDRLSHFKFPIETVDRISFIPFGLAGYALQSKEGARVIANHFQRDLEPLSRTYGNLFAIESIVITTPCATDHKKMGDYVSAAASDGFKWTKITNQDRCANKQVIVIPVEYPELIDELEPAVQCRQQLNNIDNIQHSGLLRNTVNKDYYLSVENDQEGTRIHLDRHWGNSTGQRWRFVNNTLRNDNGKCLTAWTERSTFLYQYDCHPGWAGQIWIRHGLQVVNGFRFCLAVQNSKNGSNSYAVQALCDSTPQFLWYEWDGTCRRRPNISNSVGQRFIQS